MLGGIYGDLAASTYLRDPKIFYERLFDDKATLSEYGLTILAQSELCGLTYDAPKSEVSKVLNRYFKKPNRSIVNLSDTFLQAKDSAHYLNNRGGLIAINNAVSAWWVLNDEFWPINVIPADGFPFEKCDGYARLFLRKIISHLLNGRTKDQVYNDLGEVFKGIRHDWDWRNTEGDILCYVLRAWDCFYHAFDFGSAIHNAVKCVGDTRLNATLTGMIAEAMYGCGSYFVKEKYCDKKFYRVDLSIKKEIYSTYENAFEIIREQRRFRNIFFKKNDALINVERHTYKAIPNEFSDIEVSPELYRRMLQAYGSSWDARYGLYFDNGWLYVYRSGIIIGRFHLIRKDDGTYRIHDTQISDESHDFNIAMRDGVIYTCQHCWGLYTDFHFKYFSPFSNSPDICPYEQNSIKAKFWHGENMFFHTQMENIYHWIDVGMKILTESKNPLYAYHARKLGLESFAIIIYINMLYDKWHPYENTDWVFSY